ncbi:class I SAM-dependent methyltransferase [Balneolaceae bacterium YR4-1]|uniref:Class I SAM-dependent methyltransferase n=1 Tax=Halalkalibaculum roseum TaxID=2709311 RepID=A0A6M1SWY8_9BACT|nr:class I SAM-dependent methyltransferase [Halalkalibaculum roseum]NGP76718.1 class I SAM-dependent methyltransferase [Halalkalibaculum roseum]
MNNAKNSCSKLLIPLLLFFLTFTTLEVKAQDLDVPYVPTPQKVVERMLDLADVNSSDYVIDLGSGDGRIVITAAKRGATGHGIDLDPQRISEARTNAVNANVADRVMFMEANIFNTDFSNASVITMYLLPTVNEKLRPELLDKLEPGTRVVSHSFDMDEWEADKEVIVNDNQGSGTHDIYFWVIPAKVEGSWSWQTDDKNFTMNVTQRFQEISANLSDSQGNSYRVEAADLRGKRINIRAVNGDVRYILSGRVEGDEIIGVQQQHTQENKSFTNWRAGKQ